MRHIFRQLLLAFALVALVGLTACGSDVNDRVENIVSLRSGERVSFSSTSQFVTITSAEKWTITAEYTAPEGVADWCTFTPSEGEGNTSVMMKYGKNTLEVERSLTLTVSFASGERIVKQFSQTAQSSNITSTHPAWLELPSFDASDNTQKFITHYMPDNAKVRSFSILYDTEHYIPTWVAYTLHTSNVGSGARTNAWGFDPSISQADQVDLSRSYSGSYDRGHMLPSASRLTSDAANAQTFYYTNMTPQLSSLNQDGWATIEGQVRGWKGNNATDTLYVVTGAVLQTVGGNEPIVNISAANGTYSSKPNYYYKALLKLTRRNGEAYYQAMAIWVEHKSRSYGATADDIISIDELERRTGIDFFANLDDRVEDSVEESVNLSFWGF